MKTLLSKKLLIGIVAFLTAAAIGCGDNLYEKLGADYGVTVTPGTVVFPEQGEGDFTVVLDAEPQDDVIINMASPDVTEAEFPESSITFTADNWDTPQTVVVIGVDDTDKDGNVSVDLILTMDSSSSAEYQPIDPDDITVTVLDDDIPGITVTPVVTTFAENASGSFTVNCNSFPIGNVVINVTSGTPGEATVSPAQLTFTPLNWAAPQTVTLNGVTDAVDDDNQTVNIDVAMDASTSDADYAILTPDDVSVTVTDIDTAGVTVTPVVTTFSENGGTGSYTVVLNSKPTGNVVIDVTSDDLTEATVDPADAQLIFTTLNWSTPQTVNLTGVNDGSLDTDQTFDIDNAMNTGSTADTKYDLIDPADVSVTVIDDESPGVTVTPGTTTFSENGGTGSFDVVLITQPVGANVVEIDITSSDTGEATVSPATLTFNNGNWNSAQTVNLTGVNDPSADGRQDVTILIVTNDTNTTENAYDAVDPADVPVIVLDDEWTPRQTNCVWRSVAASSSGQYQVAVIENTTSGATAGIWTSSNYGRDWTQRSSVGRNYRCAASDSTGQYLAVAAYGGYIYISNDWGATWAQRGGSLNWNSLVSSSDGQRLIGVVWAGGIYLTSDRGDNWTNPGTNPGRTYTGVASDSTGRYLVACVNTTWPADAFVWHSRDWGATWTADSATARNYTSVSSDSSGQYIVATVSASRVIYLATNGTTADALTLTATGNISAANANWYSTCTSSNGSIITAVIYGDYGVGSRGIWRSVDNGNNWTNVDINSRNYYDISCAADGTGLAAVVNGGSIYTSY